MSVKIIPITKKYRANYDKIFDKTYWNGEITRKERPKQADKQKHKLDEFRDVIRAKHGRVDAERTT